MPFTRAGCTVGDVSTANMVLENTAVDIANVFGAGSPEATQLAADRLVQGRRRTPTTSGIGVHCAQGDAILRERPGGEVRAGHARRTTAVTDLLPDEPGGYTGYQALFGHRYIAPQLGAGTANLSHNGYQVTNGAGNLVDLSGNEIDGTS